LRLTTHNVEIFTESRRAGLNLNTLIDQR